MTATPAGPRLTPRVALLALACVVIATPARAQQPDSTRRDSTARAADGTARRDTLTSLQRLGDQLGARPPISPRKAFLYSFLVPGLGQARLDRPNGGALFASVELGAIVMAIKSRQDLDYARAANARPIVTAWELDADTLVAADTLRNRYGTRIRARRVHYEDWIAVLVFNHLFAGADAFVAAQLWDMPVRGSLRMADPRTAVLGASLQFGGRRRR